MFLFIYLVLKDVFIPRNLVNTVPDELWAKMFRFDCITMYNIIWELVRKYNIFRNLWDSSNSGQMFSVNVGQQTNN